jgi:hypothetical protein
MATPPFSFPMSGGKFVTAFFGNLDAEATRIEYVNAGHPYPGLMKMGTGSAECCIFGPIHPLPLAVPVPIFIRPP